MLDIIKKECYSYFNLFNTATGADREKVALIKARRELSLGARQR